MKQQIDAPPDHWLVFDERYKTPSIEPAAMEPDNGNGWYDPVTKTLHFVVATQCPLEAATETKATVVTASKGVISHTMEEEGETIPDPHAWHNLANAEIYVNNIKEIGRAHV